MIRNVVCKYSRMIVEKCWSATQTNNHKCGLSKPHLAMSKPHLAIKRISDLLFCQEIRRSEIINFGFSRHYFYFASFAVCRLVRDGRQKSRCQTPR